MSLLKNARRPKRKRPFYGLRTQREALFETLEPRQLLAAVSGSGQTAPGQTYALQLDAEGQDVSEWNIDWGDGQSSSPDGTATIAEHAYASAGTYEINASALDNGVWTPVTTGHAGELDQTFGIAGVVRADIGQWEWASDVAIQSDGKLLVLGNVYGNNEYEMSLLRYHADGTVDTSYGDHGVAAIELGGSYAYAYALAVQSDDHAVVVGYNDSGDFVVTRVNDNGFQDAGFGNGGIASADIDGWDYANDVTVDAFNNIVAVGSDGSGNVAVAKFAATGTLDASFGLGGVVSSSVNGTWSYASAGTVQPDGKVLVAGSAQGDMLVVRYNQDGTPDASFGNNGVVLIDSGSWDSAYDIGVFDNDTIYVTGYDGSGDYFVARLDGSGTLDASFGGTGMVTTDISDWDSSMSLSILPQGDVVVGGMSGDGQMVVIRYQPDGSLDSGFADSGLARTGESWNPSFSKLTSDRSGNVFLVGTTSDNDGEYYLAKLSGGQSSHRVTVQSPLQVTGPAMLAEGSDYTLSLDSLVPITDWSIDWGDGSASEIVAPGEAEVTHVYADDGVYTISVSANGQLLAAEPLQVDVRDVAPAVTLSGSASVDRGADYVLDIDVNDPGDDTVTRVTVNWGDGVTETFTGNVTSATHSYHDGEQTYWISVAVEQDSSDWTYMDYVGRPGSLDGSFGGGRVTNYFTSSWVDVQDVVVQADGKILIAGTDSGKFAVFRYTERGTLDATFAGSGKVAVDLGDASGSAYAMTLQPDGLGRDKILLAGYLDGDFAVVRLDADGELDHNFGDNGVQRIDIRGGWDDARGITVQPDGKILVAGTEGSYGDFAVTRLEPDGQLDSSFGENGNGTTSVDIAYGWDWATDVALQSDGGIILAGSDGGGGKFALVRLDAHGYLDPSFGGNGRVTTQLYGWDGVNGLAIQDDDKIIAAGYEGGGNFGLARYHADGLLDTSFGEEGIVLTDFGGGWDGANDVLLQPDGKIIAVGYDHDGDFAVARYNSNGSLDPQFDDDGRVLTDFGEGWDYANAVALDNHGNIVVAGTSYNAYGRVAVARYYSGLAGKGVAVEMPVTIQGATAVSEGQSYTLQLDRKSQSVDFWEVDWGDGSDVQVVPGDQEFASHVYVDGPATFEIHAKGVESGARHPSNRISVEVRNVVPELTVTGSGHAPVGGNYTLQLSADDPGADNILRWQVNWGDGNVTTYDGNRSQVTHVYEGVGDHTVSVLAEDDDGWHSIGAVGAPGALDPTFGGGNVGGGGRVLTGLSGGWDTGRDAAILPDGRIIVAGTASPATRDFSVVRYHANGTLDTSFSGDGKAAVDFAGKSDHGEGVAVQPDGKIIVAGSATLDNYDRDFGLARFNDDGTLDTTFGVNGKVTTDVGSYDYAYDVALQRDGKIVVSGTSHSDFAVARYLPNGQLDATFGDGGVVVTDLFGGYDVGYGMTIQADGKIVVAGQTNRHGSGDFGLIRYLSNGALDVSFGPDHTGKVATDFDDGYESANGVAAQSDGKLVAIGSDGKNFALVRYRTDGTLDTGFGPNGDGLVSTDIQGHYESAYDIVLQPDNKIVVAGVEGWQDFGLVRYTAAGIPDPTFGAGGKVTTDFDNGSDHGYAVLLDPHNQIVVAGAHAKYDSQDYTSSYKFALARYLSGLGVHSVSTYDVFAGSTYAVTNFGLGRDTGPLAADLVSADPTLSLSVTDGGAPQGGVLVQFDVNGDGIADANAVTAGDGVATWQPDLPRYDRYSIRARALQWDPAATTYYATDWSTLAFTFAADPAGAYDNPVATTGLSDDDVRLLGNPDDYAVEAGVRYDAMTGFELYVGDDDAEGTAVEPSVGQSWSAGREVEFSLAVVDNEVTFAVGPQTLSYTLPPERRSYTDLMIRALGTNEAETRAQLSDLRYDGRVVRDAEGVPITRQQAPDVGAENLRISGGMLEDGVTITGKLTFTAPAAPIIAPPPDDAEGESRPGKRPAIAMQLVAYPFVNVQSGCSCTCVCSCSSVSSSFDLQTGDFQTSHNGTKLSYRSSTANARLLLPVDLPVTTNTLKADYVQSQLTFGPATYAPTKYESRGVKAGESARFTTLVDTSSLPTGRYTWEYAITEQQADKSSTRFRSGARDVVNRGNSVFGNGWAPANYTTLKPQSGGNRGASLVTGAGDLFWFQQLGTNSFLPAAGTCQYTTLARNPDGSYTMNSGGESQTQFTADGLPIATTDRNGNVTKFIHTDGDGDSVANELSQVVSPSGRVTKYGYHNGRVQTITDHAERVTTLAHDSDGNLVSITSPDPDGDGPQLPPVTLFTYGGPSGSLLTGITTPDGLTESITYSSAGTVESRELTSGGTIELDAELLSGWIAPDSGGNVPQGGEGLPLLFPTAEVHAATRDPLGRETEVVSDSFGNPTIVRSPDGTTSWNSYDRNGRLTLAVEPDPDGPGSYSTSYTRDWRGNVTSVTYPDHSSESWVYHPTFDIPLSHLDPRGNVTQYEVDPSNGNVLSVRQVVGDDDLTSGEGDDVTTSYIYTSSGSGTLGGLVQMAIEPAGRLTEFAYAPTGQLEAVSFPDFTSRQFEYDPVTDNLSATLDELGRRTEYTYDNLDRLTQLTLPDSATYVFEYDGMNRPLSETDPLDRTTTYTYDVPQNRQTVTAPDGTSTTYQYDVAGQLTDVTDPLGRVTQFTYDAAGNQDRIVLPAPSDGAENPVYDFNYDSRGRLTAESDPLGNTVSYRYENFGRRQITTYPSPDGVQVVSASTEYDAAGNPIAVTDPLQRTTTYVYDELNRLTATTLPDPDGSGPATAPVISRAYTQASELSRLTDALGNVTNYRYDLRGRLYRVMGADPDGAGPLTSPVTTYRYDDAGNPTTITDPLGNQTQSTYDELNRLLSRTEAFGTTDHSTVEYTYDLAGNLLTRTDSSGVVTQFTYDLHDRLIAEQPLIDGPDDYVTSYVYDAAGNRLSLTDASGNTTTWRYDDLNRMVLETNELGDSRSYVYDLVGNLKRKTDRNGRVTEFGYDNLYRRTAEYWLDAANNVVRTLHWQYDEAGNLISASDPAAAYAYSYDGLNRRTSVTHSPTESGIDVVMASTYDNNGNRTSLAATIDGVADFLNTYTYDHLHRMTSVAQSSQLGSPSSPIADKLVTFSYNPSHQFDTITRYADLAGTQLVAASTYTYDSQHRLVELDHVDGMGIALAGYDWNYDNRGRLIRFDSLLDGTVHYEYDDLQQLTSADYDYQEDESFSYDQTGNRTNDGYRTGENNQLQGLGDYVYSYDAEGNRVRIEPLEIGVVFTYEWDHRNRLESVTMRDATTVGNVISTSTYTYDIHDRRIAKTVSNDSGTLTEYYVHDGERWERGRAGDHINLVFTDPDGPAGSAAASLTERHLYGPAVDQILATEQIDPDASSSSTTWPLPDHLGTIRDVVACDAVHA